MAFQQCEVSRAFRVTAVRAGRPHHKREVLAQNCGAGVPPAQSALRFRVAEGGLGVDDLGIGPVGDVETQAVDIGWEERRQNMRSRAV